MSVKIKVLIRGLGSLGDSDSECWVNKIGMGNGFGWGKDSESAMEFLNADLALKAIEARNAFWGQRKEVTFEIYPVIEPELESELESHGLCS